MMKKMMGFTLAEVLTTLMVIGVVAAMTIPTLMNSTNDQQLKVAYKKAMSILSQGTQLMVAKEVECKVSDDASLAQCFADHVLSGNTVNFENKGSGGQAGNNVVATSDGIAYAFYYYGDDHSSTAASLEDICGSMSDLETTEDGYNGSNSKCVVVVDVNGFAKGTKEFRDVKGGGTGSAGAKKKGSAIGTDMYAGSEQLPIILTGNGVRSVYGVGKGYEWMYGTTVQPYSGS